MLLASKTDLVGELDIKLVLREVSSEAVDDPGSVGIDAAVGAVILVSCAR